MQHNTSIALSVETDGVIHGTDGRTMSDAEPACNSLDKGLHDISLSYSEDEDSLIVISPGFAFRYNIAPSANVIISSTSTVEPCLPSSSKHDLDQTSMSKESSQAVGVYENSQSGSTVEEPELDLLDSTEWKQNWKAVDLSDSSLFTSAAIRDRPYKRSFDYTPAPLKITKIKLGPPQRARASQDVPPADFIHAEATADAINCTGQPEQTQEQAVREQAGQGRFAPSTPPAQPGAMFFTCSPATPLPIRHHQEKQTNVRSRLIPARHPSRVYSQREIKAISFGTRVANLRNARRSPDAASSSDAYRCPTSPTGGRLEADDQGANHLVSAMSLKRQNPPELAQPGHIRSAALRHKNLSGSAFNRVVTNLNNNLMQATP